MWVSTCLFGRFEPKKRVLQKVGATCAFGLAQNATFWKKLRFGPRLIMRWERANLMELRRSIKQKVQCAFVTIRWLFLQLPITLDKSPQFSRLKLTLTPFISSLCSPFALKLNLTPLISSIIKIQTQKHNLKINQTTTIKAKKFLLSQNWYNLNNKSKIKTTTTAD